jgi:tetratricopeptide (TPR) repeat protein
MFRMAKRSRKRRASPGAGSPAGDSASAKPSRGEASPSSSRAALPVLPVAVIVLVTAAVGGYLLWTRSQSGPPATESSSASDSAATRFVGGRDDGYLDPSTCAGCHQEIHDTYRHTGMGRSFSRPRPEIMVEDFERNNTYYHEASGRHYTMIERGGDYYQCRHELDSGGKPIHTFEQKVDFVIGSGNHARSYLHLDEYGKLTQMPLGWYSENGGFWAMSPGYDQPRHKGFGREISFDCMFCHNGYPKIAPGEDLAGRDARYQGRLAEGIDCQRCHGPGRAHVEAAGRSAAASEIRDAIVNPAELSVDGQIEMCMQCHLETTSRRLPYAMVRAGRGAFSFRPGDPLSDYILHFTHADGKGPADHFEIAHAAFRLRKSACFQQTQNLPPGQALTCTSCHDPHDIPRGEEAVQRYVSACTACHGDDFTQLVAAGKHTGAGNCLDCHMPKRRTDDVVQVVMTDHYIQRRKPGRDLLAAIRETADTPQNAYQGEVALYYPPRLEEPEDELYLAAAQVTQESNLSAGIPRLERAIEKFRPEGGEFYFQLAEAYWKNGEAEKSFPFYEQAIQRSPHHRAALRNYALALSRSGKAPQALDVLRRALAAEPNDAKALSNLGEVLLQQDSPQPALEALRKAVRIDPNLPEAQSNLASALARTGDPSGANAAAREAIRIQPDHEAAHINLANLLAGQGAADEAALHYRQVLALNPDHAEAHYNYGVLLAGQEKFREAESQMREALLLSPGLAGAHNNLGNLLAMRGEIGEALGHFRAAIQADPNSEEAHFNLGTALGTQNQHQQAAEHFATALRLNPQSQQARLNLGFALAAQGDLAGARQQFQQVAQSADQSLREAASHALRQLDTQ